MKYKLKYRFKKVWYIQLIKWILIIFLIILSIIFAPLNWMKWILFLVYFCFFLIKFFLWVEENNEWDESI